MSKQHQNWRQSALAALIISLGAAGAIELPVEAGQSSLKLAQVGVRSRINSPTPLNLRPRTHIPLPTNSRSRDYYSHPRYRGSYRNDKYGYHHYRTHRRGHRRGGTVIIINPAESYSNRYLRIIKK